MVRVDHSMYVLVILGAERLNEVAVFWFMLCCV